MDDCKIAWGILIAVFFSVVDFPHSFVICKQFHAKQFVFLSSFFLVYLIKKIDSVCSKVYWVYEAV